MESQIGFIAPLSDLFKPKNLPYVEIIQDDNFVLKFVESRGFLATLGVDGQIISTPGHSDDSLTLILDEGFAFTGDLQPLFMLADDTVSRESWDRIQEHKITRIFPGHGGG